MQNEIIERIKLFLIPGIGHLLARHLITFAGSAAHLFELTKKELYQIPGLGQVVANNLLKHKDYQSRAEDEYQFIHNQNVEVIFFDDDRFPYRLNESPDPPFMLFFKGSSSLNPNRCLAIVGTRKASNYGKDFIHRLVQSLKPYNVCIVSGLAYGTDITAHRACLENGVPTIGVVAHGLDRIYPHVHRNTAKEMQENGGILSDFLCHTKPDRENFPKRNRIIAGMTDATIITEAAAKGGALITGRLAFDYDRSVFALPGKIHDSYSQGCNHLIKQQKAQLITEPEDIIASLGWEKQDIGKQINLFEEMNDQERKIAELIRSGNSFVEDLSLKLQTSFAELQTTLFDMEMNGWIHQLPGNRVELRN